MPRNRVLLAPVGDRTLALPITSVRQVLALDGLTPVPLAPPVVLGLANVRGEAVPVLDAARLLDGNGGGDENEDEGDRAGARPRFVVVVDTSRGPAGLAVSGIPEPVPPGVAASVVDVDALIGP